MLLDMRREERVMVPASVNNERDFDKVADALIIQHPRIHFRESRKRAKRKGKDGMKSSDNLNIRWLQEKGKHTGNEKTEGSVYHANFTSAEGNGYNDDKVGITDAYHAHNDPVNPGSDVGEEALDARTTRKTTCLFHMLLSMTFPFTRQLNLMQSLFSLTRGTMILTQKLACSWCKQMYKLTSPSERRTVKEKARANFLFDHHVCH